MVAPVAAVEEVEDIPTGMIHMQAAITTPVDTPMGMKTYGLDIVVKFYAHRCFSGNFTRVLCG